MFAAVFVRLKHGQTQAAAILRLPDFAFFLAHHCVALLAPKRLREQLHIREWTIHAELWNRMFVAVGHEPGVLRAEIRAPYLRPAKKKPLLRTKTVPILRALSCN